MIEQAKIQEKSLEDLIENIECYEKDLKNNNKNNSQFDQQDFNDSIHILSQWISDKAVSNLIEKWDLFRKQCQVKLYSYKCKLQATFDLN